MRLGSMNLAPSRASSALLTSLTNPALPRPPAYTCALTTHIGALQCLNACAAPSGLRTTPARAQLDDPPLAAPPGVSLRLDHAHRRLEVLERLRRLFRVAHDLGRGDGD